MTLIVEDGSVVSGANTYLTEAEAATLLDDYFGITATITESQLKMSAQWLESFRNNYQGNKVSSSQSLQFPRISVYVDCVLLPSDEIPQELKLSQALAAYEISNGSTLQQNSTGQTVTSKSIAGQISVQYSDNGLGGQTIFNQINSYLDLLLKSQLLQTRVFRV